jgi:flavodoxin I
MGSGKMGNVIIVYGSTMGTTERMAGVIARELRSSGIDVIEKNVINTGPEELKDHKMAILGCSTWGDGELQQDFIGFEEKLREADMSGKMCAVFGPGDSIYPQFCKAVDILEGTLKGRGARMAVEGLRADMSEDGLEDKARSWSRKIARILR